MENTYIYSITSFGAYNLINDFIGTINPGHDTQDIKIRALAFEKILSERYHGAAGFNVQIIPDDFKAFESIGTFTLLNNINKILIDIDTLRDGFPLLGSLLTGYQRSLEVFSQWQKDN